MIIGLRGQVDRIDSLAAGLAASDDRRIFLALLAAALRGRGPERSARIAAMLPDEEDQPRDARILGERYFQWSA